MDPVIFFIVLASIYFIALFFDLFFKSCMHYPYDAFLRNTGLTVQLFRLKWYTTAFNRTIFKWGSSWNRFFTQSFNVGVIVSLGLLPIGVFILFTTLFNTQNHATVGNKVMDAKIEILLPGINLPLDEIGFYISTLVICTIVHELGHALAAVLEDIPVTGFGLQIYFCIPLAYTELSSEHLNALKSFRKMRVLCAGIWHNMILSAFCYLLYTGLGIFIGPFYHMNDAVTVTDITKTSPLLGEKGLFVGDIVTDMNDCRVRDVDTWYACMVKSIKIKPAFCVSSDFIRLNDESGPISHGYDGVIQCCDPTNIKMCCFEYIDDLSNDDPIEIPQHVCLDIRKTIEDSSGFCAGNCDKGFCIRPLLNNVTTIITLRRKHKSDVIYIGHPADISRSVRISPFVPKTSYLSPQLADSLLLFLKYNIVFSLGLAIINSIPCFGLDGHHISGTIINNFLVNKISERGKRELIVLLVTSLGTLLFISSIIKVLWHSIYKSLY